MKTIKLKHARTVTRILLRTRTSIGPAALTNLSTQAKCTSAAANSTRMPLDANLICTTQLKRTKARTSLKTLINPKLSRSVSVVSK